MVPDIHAKFHNQPFIMRQVIWRHVFGHTDSHTHSLTHTQLNHQRLVSDKLAIPVLIHIYPHRIQYIINIECVNILRNPNSKTSQRIGIRLYQVCYENSHHQLVDESALALWRIRQIKKDDAEKLLGEFHGNVAFSMKNPNFILT